MYYSVLWASGFHHDKAAGRAYCMAFPQEWNFLFCMTGCFLLQKFFIQ